MLREITVIHGRYDDGVDLVLLSEGEEKSRRREGRKMCGNREKGENRGKEERGMMRVSICLLAYFNSIRQFVLTSIASSRCFCSNISHSSLSHRKVTCLR